MPFAKSLLPHGTNTFAVSPSQEIEIASRYLAGESTVKLAIAFGTTNVSIAAALGRKGIRRRSQSESHRDPFARHDAFDSITDDSAYWMGVLVTDGCVSSGRVVLGLQDADRNHIEAFRKFIGWTGKINSYFRSASKRHNGHTVKSGIFTKIAIRSKPLSESLVGWGITPRKTFTAKAHADLESNRHFWRGCIDGDGMVFQYKRRGKNIPRIGLTGSSRSLIEQFFNYIMGIIPNWNGKTAWRQDRYGSVTVSGSRAIKLVRHFYTDAPTSLFRKAEIAKQIIEYADAHPEWCQQGRWQRYAWKHTTRQFKHPEPVMRQMCNDYQSGMPIAELTNKYGYARPSTLHGALRDCGIPSNRHKGRPRIHPLGKTL